MSCNARYSVPVSCNARYIERLTLFTVSHEIKIVSAVFPCLSTLHLIHNTEGSANWSGPSPQAPKSFVLFWLTPTSMIPPQMHAIGNSSRVVDAHSHAGTNSSCIISHLSGAALSRMLLGRPCAMHQLLPPPNHIHVSRTTCTSSSCTNRYNLWFAASPVL